MNDMPSRIQEFFDMIFVIILQLYGYFFYFLLKCFQFMLQILLFCTSAIISNIAIASSELCDLVQNHPFSGSWYPFMSLWLGKSQIESLEARLNDQSGR